ncbi:MAG: peptide deformylase [Endomicrobium sp.]|jgi:peptide deformylase|nr:peptide deformylase [Endomicrobium sp.]
MTKLDIRKYGDPVLRKKSKEVPIVNDDVKRFAQDMLETMYAAKGVGLAAPQAGVLSRICVIDTDTDKKFPIIMINPKIVLGEGKVVEQEGCLSLPKLFAEVKRFSSVVAQYTDINGKNKEIEARDLLARTIQHEIDHLDAKIFIDYLPDWKRKNIEKEVKRRRKKGNW